MEDVAAVATDLALENAQAAPAPATARKGVAAPVAARKGLPVSKKVAGKKKPVWNKPVLKPKKVMAKSDSKKALKKWFTGKCGEDYKKFWKDCQNTKQQPLARGNKLQYPAIAGVVHDNAAGVTRKSYKGPAISYKLKEPMSRKTCYLLCLPHETMHFAMHGDVCLCFDRASLGVRDKSKCSLKCKGDNNGCGGGSGESSVYMITEHVPPSKVPGGVTNRKAFRDMKKAGVINVKGKASAKKR